MLTILTILLIWNQFGGWFRKMFCKIGLHGLKSIHIMKKVGI